METFRKTGSPQAIAAEAAGLRWLAEAAGAAVAELVRVEERWLETALLDHARPSAEDAAAFGRALARTHAAGATHWGCPPPGSSVGRLAELAAPMAQTERWTSFGTFFAEARLEPYLYQASALEPAQRKKISAAIDRVAEGRFDSAQPGLCQASGAAVARIHGDLWGGNVVWARRAEHIVGTLIDPAAHGGHAETDLAELGVFHTPQLAALLSGYQEVSPLADGWQDRIPMHQLHMLLVHVTLFGASYAAQATALAERVN